MVNNLLKDLSILKKFLFINFLIFIVIGSFTFLYLNSVQPNLIKKKPLIISKSLKIRLIILKD